MNLKLRRCRRDPRDGFGYCNQRSVHIKNETKREIRSSLDCLYGRCLRSRDGRSHVRWLPYERFRGTHNNGDGVNFWTLKNCMEAINYRWLIDKNIFSGLRGSSRFARLPASAIRPSSVPFVGLMKKLTSLLVTQVARISRSLTAKFQP